MRIRFVEPRNAGIDGVDLSAFTTGHVYEMDGTIAAYLIMSGVAEPCDDGSPALVVTTNEVMVSVFAGAGQAVADVADDWET